MKSEDEPGDGPQEQITLALKGVDVGKEARHKKCGDQERQGDEALLYQNDNQFSAQKSAAVRSYQGAEFLRVVTCWRAPVTQKGTNAATQRAAPDTKQGIEIMN